jgi:hypothetical protein
MRRRLTLQGLFPMAWLSALALNAGLVLLAVSAAFVYAAASRPDVYGFDATPSALASTRRSVEDLARALTPADADRAPYWARLVLAELDAGDISAARGLLVAARVMLPARDAARLEAKLPAAPDDAAVAGAALAFLDPDVRVRFEGAALAPSKRGALIVGAAGDLEQRARALQAGQTASDLDATLLALALAMREESDGPFQAGAATLLAAQRAGALSPALASYYRHLLGQALPGGPLSVAIAEASQPGAGESFETALIEAVRRRVDERGYAALRAGLSDLADILGAASPTGAVRLLDLADSANDVARLRLVALAAGEISVAVAKRGNPKDLIDAAAGTWRLTSRDWIALAGFATALLVITLAGLAGIARALREARTQRTPAPNLGADGDDLDATYRIKANRGRRD